MRKTDAVAREELFDSEDEREVPGRLGYYLKLCDEELRPAFRRLDKAALEHQRSHRRLTAAVTAFGTAALLIGTFELALPKLLASDISPALGKSFEAADRFLPWIEGGFAIVAALFVLVGLGSKRHRAWLLTRYQAERLRLLKFRGFSDPNVWSESAPSAEWERVFRRELAQIGQIEGDDLESISHHEPLPAIPDPDIARAVPEPTRRELLVYYRIKRLEPQMEYFHRRARRVFILDNPVFLPLIFFGSIGAVILQFAIERTRSDSAWAVIFTMIALALPASWAGLRTFRSANEFARNRSRSLAKENALAEIADRLGQEREPAAFFSDIMLAEYILAADQHEWLRLMLDAEWYG